MTVRPTSVIVCTHNRAALLPLVVGQLRAQEYPKDSFEIIVVDNCSTDNTPQVVERIISEPGVPVRYIAESRAGVTYARNRGAEEARYPYLAYLDDDCSVQQDWLAQLLSGFDLDENVVLVAGRIVVDFDSQQRPSWLGPKSERWLGAYDLPGSHTRLLDLPDYVCEANMALKRDAWKAVGGFLGMERFGSPHVAAQEIRILLKNIERTYGKVAYVPQAIVLHHPDVPTRKWMVRRSFFHGISEGLLDYFLYRRSWIRAAYQTVLDIAAMAVFLFLSAFFFIVLAESTATYHLLRAVARFGKILSELRLVGGWKSVRLWEPEHTSRSRRIGMGL